MFYLWTSRAAFDAWHDGVCAALGIPYPNSNVATGEIDPDAQWTLRYTDVIEVAPNDWRAFVENDIASVFLDGLGTPCDPPFVSS